MAPALACNALVDLSGLTGTQGDAGGVPLSDAAVEAAVSDASDAATSDANRQDAEGASDAGADAIQDAAQTADARFCAARDAAATVFCDDFDDPGRTAMAATGWQQVYGFPIGTIVLSPAFSAPQASHFVYGNDSGTTRCGAAKLVPFAAGKSEIVVTARVLPVAGSDFGGFFIQGDTDCPISWRNVLGGNIETACGGSGAIEIMTVPSLAAGTWTLVSISLRKTSPGTVHMTVKVGEGAGAATIEGDYSLPDGGTMLTNSLQHVILGNASTDGTGTITFDDVVVETY